MNKTPNNQIKQLNFKVSPDFYWKLKNRTTKERCLMADLLAKAWNFYEKREQIIKEINTYRQTIQAIEQQMQPFQGRMDGKELELKINNLNPVYFEKIGLVNTCQVLKETLTECLKLGRESRLNC